MDVIGAIREYWPLIIGLIGAIAWLSRVGQTVGGLSAKFDLLERRLTHVETNTQDRLARIETKLDLLLRDRRDK